MDETDVGVESLRALALLNILSRASPHFIKVGSGTLIEVKRREKVHT